MNSPDDAQAAPSFSSLRRAPLQQRGEKRVRAVLDACEALLEDIPFDKITVNAISKKADVPVGVIYFFFDDRTNIYLCLIERVVIKIRKEFELGHQDVSMPLNEYLHMLERRLARLWDRYRAMMDLYFTYRRHPTVAPTIESFHKFATSQIAHKLRQAFPELTQEKAVISAQVLERAIIHNLDLIAYMPSQGAKVFHKEWCRMMDQYVATLGQDDLAHVRWTHQLGDC
jgi:AcrR family transcriptional regulator